MKNKVCTKCGDGHPATTEYFYRDERYKGGLTAQCKKCIIIQTTKYAKNHRKEFREQRRIIQKRYRKTIKGYLYIVIDNIKKRCYNLQNPGYKNYGNQGIELKFTHDELFK